MSTPSRSVLGGADAIAFLNQYQQAGGKAKFIAGSITVDPAILTSQGRAKEALMGTPAGSPIADNWDDPSWQKFVKLYQDTFPADQRFPTPSLFAANYYIATKAALDGLNAVKGDLVEQSRRAAQVAVHGDHRHAGR